MPDQFGFDYSQTFQLEAGGSLPGFRLFYSTLGTLNESRSNVVWICHALTGSSDFTDWWAPLSGPDGPFDPTQHFIICANMLGSCYGSTGPLSTNPETSHPFYHDFPFITNRDNARAFDLLRESLGINRIQTLIGGSLGGQQALEWAVLQPDLVENLILIATNARHSSWGIAFNEAQRMAIQADQTWKQSIPSAGMEGMKAARAIGMISYRQYATFEETQVDTDHRQLKDFRAATYQRHQGTKLGKRFNAFSYYYLSLMMDAHHLGRGRGPIDKVLAAIKSKTLVVGIDTDILFPLKEQEFLAATIPGAELRVITSLYGHDGFLVEFRTLNQIIVNFLERNNTLHLI